MRPEAEQRTGKGSENGDANTLETDVEDSQPEEQNEKFRKQRAAYMRQYRRSKASGTRGRPQQAHITYLAVVNGGTRNAARNKYNRMSQEEKDWVKSLAESGLGVFMPDVFAESTRAGASSSSDTIADSASSTSFTFQPRTFYVLYLINRGEDCVWVASLSCYANLPGFLEALVNVKPDDGMVTYAMACCILESLVKPTSIEGVLKHTARSSYPDVHSALIDTLPAAQKRPFVFRLSFDLICTNEDCKKKSRSNGDHTCLFIANDDRRYVGTVPELLAETEYKTARMLCKACNQSCRHIAKNLDMKARNIIIWIP